MQTGSSGYRIALCRTWGRNPQILRLFQFAQLVVGVVRPYFDGPQTAETDSSEIPVKKSDIPLIIAQNPLSHVARRP